MLWKENVSMDVISYFQLLQYVAMTATFVVLFVLCFLVALVFPNASLTHNWLGLFSTAPVGSAGQLIQGIIWNVLFAWIAAIVFGVVYNRLAPNA